MLSEDVQNIFIENKNMGNWERDDLNIKLKNVLKQATHMQQKSLEKRSKTTRRIYEGRKKLCRRF